MFGPSYPPDSTPYQTVPLSELEKHSQRTSTCIACFSTTGSIYPPYVERTTNRTPCLFHLNGPPHIGCQDYRATFADRRGRTRTCLPT